MTRVSRVMLRHFQVHCVFDWTVLTHVSVWVHVTEQITTQQPGYRGPLWHLLESGFSCLTGFLFSPAGAEGGRRLKSLRTATWWRGFEGILVGCSLFLIVQWPRINISLPLCCLFLSLRSHKVLNFFIITAVAGLTHCCSVVKRKEKKWCEIPSFLCAA